MSEEERKTVVCRGLFGEEVEVPLADLRFRPGAYGILFRDDSVLLSRQWEDGWDFPGGGVEIGETILEALVREYKEETGLLVGPVKIIHVEDHFFQPKFDQKQHWQSIAIYYLCKYISGEISTEGFVEYEKKYMQEAQWIPIKDIDTLKFYNHVDSPALIRAAIQEARPLELD